MKVHAAPWVLPILSPPVKDGAVAVDARGVIVEIGPARTLARLGTIEEHAGVLLPGLVNAHAHVELSHLSEQVPGGEGLVPWIRRLLAIRDQVSDPSAVRRAAAYLASRGTVAVADVTNGGEVAGALREAGLEVLILDERVAPGGGPLAPTRAGAVAVPHATYTCDADTLRALAARSGGRVRSIHVEEDPAEAAWLLEGRGPLAALRAERGSASAASPPGLRPIGWLDALGVLGAGTLLVHLTVADDASLALAARRRAIAVLCPRSNLHIGQRLPPFDRVRASGLRVALGTDSVASSPSLDVLGEVATLAHAGADPAWLVEAATLGGAVALELDHLGALEAGRRPGLIEAGDSARTLADPIRWLAHEGVDVRVRRLA